MAQDCSLTALLRLVFLFGSIFVQTYALDCGFYHIQSVASGKNVEGHQQGLPLFVGLNLTVTLPTPHGSHEKDYTIWHIEKRFSGPNLRKPHYSIQNNATKMYAHLYRETPNLTVLIAEEEPTFFDLDFIENHEWSIQLSKHLNEDKSLWTIHEQYHQVILERKMLTKAGIPKAVQRFRFHAVQT
ncbi:hypothetical protein Agabi119p4_9024 [Agaricus bisporus var. burnettii]|uniref:Uncharacterized protein n=1 Tax=Agaricus bisporus var. burnettii TaxID=192524 RepID=A0A8H7EXS9_AGABI|nr:hypothetical protein Agabi119p4_9024 [Agaricus bisporus var. burnettii]